MKFDYHAKILIKAKIADIQLVPIEVLYFHESVNRNVLCQGKWDLGRSYLVIHYIFIH